MELRYLRSKDCQRDYQTRQRSRSANP